MKKMEKRLALEIYIPVSEALGKKKHFVVNAANAYRGSIGINPYLASSFAESPEIKFPSYIAGGLRMNIPHQLKYTRSI